VNRIKWLEKQVSLVKKERGISHTERQYRLQHLYAELAKLDGSNKLRGRRLENFRNFISKPEAELIRLRDRIEDNEKTLKALLTGVYDKGTYVEKLGIKPDTPCCVVEDDSVRRAVRKAVVTGPLAPRPSGAHLCHRCDTPKCMRPDHLFWGTRRDNMRDCVLKGRRRGTILHSTEDRIARVQARLARLHAKLRRLIDESLRGRKSIDQNTSFD